MPDEPVALISYAQNFEDIRLYKALHLSGPRTYVDIGAYHPTEDSVTRFLYEQGWCGINVEPGESFGEFTDTRPRDINVRAAITREDGTASFSVVWPYPTLSALSAVLAHSREDLAVSIKDVTIPTMRLDSLLSNQWNHGEIGVLKIDVEGAEADVIASNDWTRFRPWVVVVEAIAPDSHAPTHGHWEPTLLAAGYQFAYFDGVNRFYARTDHPEIIDALTAPVSAADYVVPYPVLELHARLAQKDLSTLGRVSMLDAEAKEAEARASRAEAAVGEHAARIGHLRRQVRALESEVNALRRSRVVRIGFRVHRKLLILRPALAPLAPVVRRVRRRRLSSARRIRMVYARRTAVGQTLETVRSSRPAPGLSDSDLAISGLYLQLRGSRASGAKLLDGGEVSLIESTLDIRRRNGHGLLSPGDDLLAKAVAFARADLAARRGSFVSDGSRNLVLVDGRALQSEARSGTGRHARAVLHEVLRLLPVGMDISFIPCELMDPLDADIMEMATVDWNPTKLHTVALYLQLAPFVCAHDDGDLALLLDPAVRKVAVFLDDIQGMYPHHFLGNEWLFWIYQMGVERLRFADAILALSETSANELRAILGDHAASTEIIVSGAVNGMADPGLLPATVAALGDFIVAVGNPLPHKNLAAAVAGAARRCSAPGGPGLVVMSSGGSELVSAIREMALEVGIPPSRTVVTGSIPDDQLAAIVRDARAIVVPSLHEGFSLPVVEGLDSGTPLAVSRLDAHQELLGDGEWMFDPADPCDVARALDVVLSNPERVLAEQRAALSMRYRADNLGESVSRALGSVVTEFPGLRAGSPVNRTVDEVLRPSTFVRSGLGLCKVCELEDFVDPDLREVMRDVFAHEVARFGSSFPDGREYRKYWEIAMAVLAFKRSGLLRKESTILGIGAGNEATCFYLTRHVGRVLATDLYESPGWEESASTSMITNPGWHWPFPWEPDRLEVRHMDALDLDLPDESVDGIFSSSSVEHFGSHDAVRRSLDEAHRVLKPGGVLSVSTEFRLIGPPPGIPGALLFDRTDIDELFVGGRSWSLVDPFDHCVSESTIGTLSSFKSQLAEQDLIIAKYGGLFTHIVQYSRYPHLALYAGARVFTSMHMALRKDS